jgi:hypothetical protein
MMSYQPMPVYTAEQLDAMSEREYRSYETRLRRAADRQGLRLQRSRLRDPRSYGYGTYQLIDVDTNGIVYADWALQRGFGLDLADVAHYLLGQDSAQS